ncbi:MAG: response regulator [Chitinispirillales bacterium]|jgi:CheY-like chemotaxis protein|nr:response regulator [Chitinispirillales bacterium]
MVTKKLLIVDDKREIRQLVRATLEDGWEVAEAETGDAAVEAAARHKPDLVVMDMMMPGTIDGMEATRRIKSAPETADCKVIMLSGSDIELREAALEAGVVEFIQKPFSPLDLMDKIGTLFGDKA